MRRFSAEYLRHTREGMWGDSREALADLELSDRQRVLDVGCGTGSLTRVLADETRGEVVGLDADRELLDVARQTAPVVRGDALRLPFADDSFDLVVCQALLINLFDRARVLAEFDRVSSDLVAAIEPDNAAVAIDSTVDAEERLEARARRAYVAGVDTDVTIGGDGVGELFENANFDDVRTTRYAHEQVVEPPYDEADLVGARRKATGEGLADHRETMLDGGLTAAAYDELRSAWREMGREVVDQMRAGEYQREETVPFYVTVGRV